MAHLSLLADDDGRHRVDSAGVQGLPGLRARSQGHQAAGDGTANHGPLGLRQGGPVPEHQGALRPDQSRQLHRQHQGAATRDNEEHHYGKQESTASVILSLAATLTFFTPSAPGLFATRILISPACELDIYGRRYHADDKDFFLSFLKIEIKINFI